MSPRATFAGLNISQLVSIGGFIMGIVTVWIHLEIRIAEINVDLTNLKQEMIMHKTDNRKDQETLRNDINANTREILRKVDEIEIYLRNRK
jgi:hypothetical protein